MNHVEASPHMEQEPAIQRELEKLGIREPVRFELSNVVEFPKTQRPRPPEEDDEMSKTKAITLAGIITVVSLAVGTVLAFIFRYVS